jgi:hypothetical protein
MSRSLGDDTEVGIGEPAGLDTPEEPTASVLFGELAATYVSGLSA